MGLQAQTAPKRLVELGAQRRLGAHLCIDRELQARGREPWAPVTQAHGKLIDPTALGRKTQTGLEIVRAIGLLVHVDQQGIPTVADLLEAVADPLEIATGVELIDHTCHRLSRELPPLQSAELRRHIAGLCVGGAGDAHLLDQQFTLVKTLAQRLSRHLPAILVRQRGKARIVRLYRLLAHGHDIGHTAEIRKPHFSELRLHQQVLLAQQRQIAFLVLPDQDVEHLVCHHQCVARQGIGVFWRLSQVRGHDDLGALLQGHLDWQIGHQATVHIGLALDFHRCKHPRCGHAGPNGEMQRTLTKHRRLTIAVARGHGPKRNLQCVEIHLRRHMGRELLQQGQKALPVTQATREAQLPGLDAKLQLDRVLALVLPGAQGQLLTVDLIERHTGRVEVADHALDLVDAQSAGIQPANHGAHAGAHQPRDRYPVALEPPQHRQVGKALGPAACQYHHHTWPGGLSRHRLRLNSPHARHQHPGPKPFPAHIALLCSA